MAKLNAYGQVELVRVSVECTVLHNDLIDWEKVEKAYMENGRVLKRRVVRFKSDGRKHDYGWKLAGHVKPGVTVKRIVTRYGDKAQVRNQGEFRHANQLPRGLEL